MTFLLFVLKNRNPINSGMLHGTMDDKFIFLQTFVLKILPLVAHEIMEGRMGCRFIYHALSFSYLLK